MKVFSNLIGKIFGKDDESPTAKASVIPNLKVKNTTALDPDKAAEKAAEEARKAATKELAAQASSNSIDVAKILDKRAKARAKEGIDWRKSIVDLMKICEMDSSFAARSALAAELGYPKDEISKAKSAKMNIWLHREMMRQIVANGGKVPRTMLK